MKYILLCLLTSCSLIHEGQSSNQEDREYHHYFSMFIESYYAHPQVCLRPPTPAELIEYDRVERHFSKMRVYFKHHGYWDDPCQRPSYNQDTLNYPIIDTIHYKILKPCVVKGYYNTRNYCKYPEAYGSVYN